ncbi:AAA family ATPase [Roseateles sp.]|uniref:AAA family ATPase n=1 Tax=Roseateles sp. TaxID=1971397 RepID=UPI003D0AFD62
MVIQDRLQSVLVKVLTVRVQNRHGVVFRGKVINEDGEVSDAYSELTARLQAGAIGTQVLAGQWWKLTGVIASRSFINAAGFEMTEEQMDVTPGNASLRLPSGRHVVDYLARNPRFTGIGPVTAEDLWEKFQDRLFSILDDGDYQALVDVVSPAKATLLVQGWQEEGLSTTLQWLQSHGVGLTIGRRILSYFGADAIDKISDNPYRLLSFSAGWNEVDQLATGHLGIAHDDPRRLSAAVEEVVYRRFSMGDTFVSRADLSMGLRTLVAAGKQTSQLLSSAIDMAESAGRLLFDLDGNAYSLGASILENRVVDAISSRLHLRSPACNVRGIMCAYEAREGLKLNAEQLEAVHLVADNHFCVITGGAGCGKTTALRVVCDVLEAQGYEVIQLALAGKAAKRMMESTGRPASTLASFIKKSRELDDSGLSRQCPVALVIDEASMVDLISFSTAVGHLNPDSKIVLIGDPHQLPPVGPGLILHCLTEISAIPHVQLKVAKRFGTVIADFATRIKGGDFPTLNEIQSPIQFTESSSSEMAKRAASLYLERPNETVVLCATRSVAQAINQRVQKALSIGSRPLQFWNFEFDQWEGLGFYEGDLLICTKNHWDIGIQNGSMGRLVSVADPVKHSSDPNLELGKVEWDDGITRSLTESLLASVELGYALTIHKSQGSQWGRVIVCLPMNKTSMRIERSLVYTAVTRAQSEVVILGNHALITQSVVERKSADRRRVGLPKRLNAILHPESGDGPRAAGQPLSTSLL